MTHLDDVVQHENLVDRVFSRLSSVGRYTGINKHVRYGRHGNTGECDIRTTHNGYTHYYEIKGHHHKNSYARAVEQFQRYKDNHPFEKIKFIYVSDKCVKRVYL